MEQQNKRHVHYKEKPETHGHRIIALAATIRNRNRTEISSDILGSYTGTGKRDLRPEQDADDL